MCFTEDCPLIDRPSDEMSVAVFLDNVTKPLTEAVYTHNKYRTVLYFSCAEFYELNGSSNATCLANSEWSDNMPVCRSKYCNLQLDIRNYTGLLLPWFKYLRQSLI